MMTDEDRQRIEAFKALYKKDPDAAMREMERSVADMRMVWHDAHNRFTYERFIKGAKKPPDPTPEPEPDQSPTDENEITQ